MKKISREKFLDQLELVGAGLSSRDVMEQAGCYVFHKGKLITFNDETACVTKSPVRKLLGAVQAEPLRAILHKMKDDTIELDQGDNELIIKVRREEIRIRMEKKIELPIESLENPTRWKTLPSKFGEAVEFVHACAGRDDSNFAMTCIHVTKQFVEACDNWQFARFGLKMRIKKDWLIKQISLKNIISLSMIEYCESKKWVHFRNARNLVMSCRRWQDKYRDMSKIASITGVKLELPKGLIEKSDRAEVLTKDNPKDNIIKVTVKPRRIEIHGEGQYGKYKGNSKLDYQGKEFDFLIQPQMLIQLVKNHTECQVNDIAMKAESGKAMFVTSLAKPSKEEPEKKTKLKKKEKK